MAQARPSSTVVLARDADDAPEVYLVRRNESSTYSDAYVFPGGVVDHTDRDVLTHCCGLSAHDADRLLCVENCGIDYYVAAIRELFEETGVLLAEHATTAGKLEQARGRLNDLSLDWSRFVAECGVSLRCDSLHYFSHWITPDVLPRRYSTRFFVARMPGEQEARYDPAELTDARWMTPADALRGGEQGELKLHFPTLCTLKALAKHDSVDALIDWADECARDGVQAIHPVLPPDDPRATLQIPDGMKSG